MRLYLGIMASSSGVALVSVEDLVRRAVQKTYGELLVLADTLKQQSVIERKRALLEFALNARRVFIRLLVLVKWSSNASNAQQCHEINEFLAKQDALLRGAADQLVASQGTLLLSRRPQFDVPTAVQVLATGSFQQMPKILEQTYKGEPPLSAAQEASLLENVDRFVRMQVSAASVPVPMALRGIDNGVATFRVEGEFEATVGIVATSPTRMEWRVRSVRLLLASDMETQVALNAELNGQQRENLCQFLSHEINAGRETLTNGLEDLYRFLHGHVLAVALEMMLFQAHNLNTTRWTNRLRTEYKPRRFLRIHYWSSSRASAATSAAAAAAPTGESPLMAMATAAGLPPPSPYSITILLDEDAEKVPTRALLLQSVGGVAIQVPSIEHFAQQQGGAQAQPPAAQHLVQLSLLGGNIELGKINVEKLIEASIERQTVDSLQYLKKLLNESENPMFDEKNVTLDCISEVSDKTCGKDDASVQVLNVGLYGQRSVRISIDQHSGTFQLKMIGVDAPNLTKKVRDVESWLNRTPARAAELIFTLRFEILFDHYELLTRRADLQLFRSIPLSPIDMIQRTELSGKLMFLQFKSSPSHYLLTSINGNQYSIHLITTRPSTTNPHQLEIEDISLPYVASRALNMKPNDYKESSAALKRRFVDAFDQPEPSLPTSSSSSSSSSSTQESKKIVKLDLQLQEASEPTRAVSLDVSDPDEVTLRDAAFKEVVAFFRLRVSIMLISQQFKQQGVKYKPVSSLHGRGGMQSIVSLDNLPDDIPEIFTKKLLDLHSDEQWACQVALFANRQSLPPFVLYTQKEKESFATVTVTSTVDKTVLALPELAAMSSPVSIVLSFARMQHAATHVVSECSRIFKLASLAMQLSAGISPDGYFVVGATKFMVLYNLVSIIFRYKVHQSDPELSIFTISLTDNAAADDAETKFKVEFTSAGAVHSKLEYFLNGMLNQSHKLLALLEVLDRTGPLLSLLKGVDVQLRSAVHMRVALHGKTTVDLFAITRDSCAVADSVVHPTDASLAVPGVTGVAHNRIPQLKQFIMHAALHGHLGKGDPHLITCLDPVKVLYDVSSTVRTSRVRLLLVSIANYLRFLDMLAQVEQLIKGNFPESPVQLSRQELTLSFASRRFDCQMYVVGFAKFGIRLAPKDGDDTGAAVAKKYSDFFLQQMSIPAKGSATIRTLVVMLKLSPAALQDDVIELTHLANAAGTRVLRLAVSASGSIVSVPNTQHSEPGIQLDSHDESVKLLFKLEDTKTGQTIDVPISYGVNSKSVSAWELSRPDPKPASEQGVLTTAQLMQQLAQREQVSPLSQTLKQLAVQQPATAKSTLALVVRQLLDLPFAVLSAVKPSSSQ